MDSIPNEVLRMFFEHMTSEQRLAIRRVCKVWCFLGMSFLTLYKTKKHEYHIDDKGVKQGPYKEWWLIRTKEHQLYEESFFVNNKRHGVRKLWFDNGQLASEENYVYGVLNGDYKRWDSRGNLFMYVFYKEDGSICGEF